MGVNNSGQPTADKAVPAIALALMLIGGLIGAVQVVRLLQCRWSSGTGVLLAVATGLAVTGIAAAIVTAFRSSTDDTLMLPLKWAGIVCSVLIVIAWLSYSSRYSACAGE